MSARALAPLGLAASAAVVAAGATFVGHRTHPLLPLAAAAAVAIAAVPPMILLHAAVALVPLELFTAQQGGTAVSPTEAAVTLAGWSWAIRRVLAGESLFVRSPLTAPLILLLIATAMGVFVAGDAAIAIKRLVLGFALFCVVQMIAADARPATIRTLLLTLVASGGVVALIAVIGAAGARPELVGFGGVAKNRATGSFNEPNVLASFLAFALPAAVALAFRTRLAVRPVLVSAFVLILVAIILSLSRGGLFAASAATLTMLAWRPVRRMALILAVTLAAFGVLTSQPLPGSQYVQTVTTRIESIRFAGAASGDFREALWTTTPHMIADNIVLGIGPGSYPDVSQRYGLIDPNQGDAIEHPHSVLLTVSVESGAIGIVALILLILRLPPTLAAAARRVPAASRGLVFAVAAGLAGFSAQGLIDYPLWSNVIAALVAIHIGSAIALWRAGEAATSS